MNVRDQRGRFMIALFLSYHLVSIPFCTTSATCTLSSFASLYASKDCHIGTKLFAVSHVSARRNRNGFRYYSTILTVRVSCLHQNPSCLPISKGSSTAIGFIDLLFGEIGSQCRLRHSMLANDSYNNKSGQSTTRSEDFSASDAFGY